MMLCIVCTHKRKQKIVEKMEQQAEVVRLTLEVTTVRKAYHDLTKVTMTEMTTLTTQMHSMHSRLIAADRERDSMRDELVASRLEVASLAADRDMIASELLTLNVLTQSPTVKKDKEEAAPDFARPLPPPMPDNARARRSAARAQQLWDDKPVSHQDAPIQTDKEESSWQSPDLG